jgi:hypothetical protein
MVDQATFANKKFLCFYKCHVTLPSFIQIFSVNVSIGVADDYLSGTHMTANRFGGIQYSEFLEKTFPFSCRNRKVGVNKIKQFVTMVHYYKYYIVGHYLSSCLYLNTSCLFFKTQRF